MIRPKTALVQALERVVGRRCLVRVSRFVLNHARRDGPNGIDRNGELLVQRHALEVGGDPALVIDVGANVGQWSGHLVDQCSTSLDLHVFEPSAGCIDRLRETLRSTDRIHVTLNQAAASSEEGEATLFKPHEMAGSSSLHDTVAADALHETVRTLTLDRYCAESDITHVDLLKVDAEGHDYHVLVGARSLLEKGAIDVLQFEYNHRWIGARRYLKDVFDLVVPLGYHVGKVTPEGIEWYPKWEPQLETLIEANYVAARQGPWQLMPAVAWWAGSRTARRLTA